MRISRKGAIALAAVAALLLLAVGTGSASAGTLCKVSESPCNPLNKYGVGEKLQFRTDEAGLWVAFTVEGSIHCSYPGFTAVIENAGSSTENVKGRIEEWNFSSCTPCPAKTLTPGTFSIQYGGSGSGYMTISGFEFEINCITTDCVYKGGFEPTPILKGGSPAVWSMPETETTLPLWQIKSGICRLKSIWKAQWDVVNHETLWLASG